MAFACLSADLYKKQQEAFVRSLFLFVFTFIFTLHSTAAETPVSPLTLEQAVSSAVTYNPTLLAAAQDVLAAQTAIRAARAHANPEAAFVPALSGPGGSDTEVLVQQPLEINGARQARTGVAQAQSAAARAGAVTLLRNIVYQTKSAYYELLRAREQQDVARTLQQSAQEFDQITRQQVTAGTRPGIDQVQTGVEAVRARQQVTQADRQVTAAQATLNTLMGRNPTNFIGTLSPPLVSGSLAQTDTALRQALASRTEIQQEQGNRAVFIQQARQARAEGVPDLVPQYRAASVTRSGQDSGFGIGISLPFFDYGSRRSRIRQAEQSAQAQQQRILAAQNQVRQEVVLAVAQINAADALIQDYQQGVLSQAKLLLDASRMGFKEGQTSVVAVLEAQRTYRAVQTEYLNALVDAAIARADLERATGSVSPDLLPHVSQ